MVSYTRGEQTKRLLTCPITTHWPWVASMATRFSRKPNSVADLTCTSLALALRGKHEGIGTGYLVRDIPKPQGQSAGLVHLQLPEGTILQSAFRRAYSYAKPTKRRCSNHRPEQRACPRGGPLLEGVGQEVGKKVTHF
ncbi:hypothetical protein Zmor_016357 [Zophobas morio]|uniref:Uncharacterized protein n=1 Tax=Zophobas morio TaxID=2755281 RepID=A0AA38HI29_9CUCU|nr:hypothetical protein Zmor_016357 [Zophobas morio]